MKKLIKQILCKLPVYQEISRTKNLLLGRLNDLDKKNEMMFWWSMNQPGESLTETQLRVYRNFPKAEGKIRTHQLEYLGILQKVVNILEKNNLIYWPMGGTMLGVVRHNAFIPWDDDLDISMLAEDKKKLFEIFEEQDDLVIEEVYWSDGLLLRCPRIRYADKNKNGCVDIFLWERADNESTGDKELWEKRQKYVKMKEDAFEKLKPSLSKHFFRGEVISNPNDKKQIDKLFENIYEIQRQECKKSGNAIYGQIDMWFEAGRWIAVYNTNDVFPLIKMKFEDIEMPIPRNYEQFLTMQYGDWLSLPSKVSPKHTKF